MAERKEPAAEQIGIENMGSTDGPIPLSAADGAGQTITPLVSAQRLRRRLYWLFVALFITSAACLVATLSEKFLRLDSFADRPSLWEWFSNWQPHPSLAHMPVVPIGGFGTLTNRPTETAWINSPDFPGTAPAQTADAGGLGFFGLIGAAVAQTEKIPSNQREFKPTLKRPSRPKMPARRKRPRRFRPHKRAPAAQIEAARHRRRHRQ